MSDVAVQSKSFLEVFFTQWVPLLSLACLALKGLLTLKNTMADTKNKDLDTKVKEFELKIKEHELAELQKKEPAPDVDFPSLEYPKFEPISGSTWLFFLAFAAANVVAFLFITFTQPLTTFSIGMLISSVVAAGLSLAIPLCVAVSNNVAYSNQIHTWTGLRFLYANMKLATLQQSMLLTQGALAQGQFEFANTMLTNAADRLQGHFDQIKKSLTKEQVEMADPVFTEFLDKTRRASGIMKVASDLLKAALEKTKLIKS